MRQITSEIKAAERCLSSAWLFFALLFALGAPSWSHQNNQQGNSGVSFPPFWVMFKDDPDSLLMAMNQTPEPFTPPILDALQNALPHFPNKSPAPGLAPANSSAIIAAEILYRYHRPAGYAYLAQQVAQNSQETEQSNVLAAIIFARKQEATMRGPILGFLPNHSFVPDLVEALGDWHDPIVKKALWETFQQNPDNPLLALALANQDAHQATPLIRHLYFSSLPDSPQKIDAAAALVKLDGSKAGQILKYLTVSLYPGPYVPRTLGTNSSDPRAEAIEAVERMGIKEAIPALQTLVRYYLTNKHPNQSLGQSGGFADYELAVSSVEALAHLHDDASKGLIMELLAALKKSGDEGLLRDTAIAALDSGIPEATVRKYLNSDDDLAHIQSLRYQEKTSHQIGR